METTLAGQVFYRQEADELVPGGCLSQGNEHGACLDRGCEWCHVYYDGPNVLFELRDCYICSEPFDHEDEAELFIPFTDMASQVVHEGCYEAMHDAWIDACRGEEAELRANYPN